MNWIKTSDRLPNKNGQYLVVYKYFDYRSIGVVRFSTNLNKVDKYIFGSEKRPGWNPRALRLYWKDLRWSRNNRR